MWVIACAGVLGWLLILAVTLGLGAAAKRGDELELDSQRYLPDSDDGARVIPFQQPEPVPANRRTCVLRRQRR